VNCKNLLRKYKNMVNIVKKQLNERTKELRDVLERAFKEENIAYDEIHPSYNSRNDINDDENLFITCYVVKKSPYGIHIDNRLEVGKWVIDIVIMKPELGYKVKQILESNGFHFEDYNGECHGEFGGHIKLMELDDNITYNEIKNINIKLLKIF